MKSTSRECTVRCRLSAVPAQAGALGGGNPIPEPSADGLTWIHIIPVGEFPGTVELPAGTVVPGLEKPVERDMEVEAVTVLDAAALERMVQGFDHSRDMLIDYEHFSHDRDKPTAAAGWGTQLRYCANRGDGAELGTRLAEPAKQQIRDQVYRHVSPEFSGAVVFQDGVYRFHPHALTGAGLTNRPKLKTLRPITTNRETGNHNETTPQASMNHKAELLKLLGLPDTATDDEIQAALPPSPPAEEITAKNREIAALKGELKILKDAAIEADLERFAPVIGEEGKENARALLSLNRELGVKLYTQLLAKLPAADGKVVPIHQKNRATPPDGAKYFADAEKADAAASAKFRAIEARAHTLVNERSIPFAHAFELAKNEAGT
jgi:phage I-like protein